MICTATSPKPREAAKAGVALFGVRKARRRPVRDAPLARNAGIRRVVREERRLDAVKRIAVGVGQNDALSGLGEPDGGVVCALRPVAGTPDDRERAGASSVPSGNV